MITSDDVYKFYLEIIYDDNFNGDYFSALITAFSLARSWSFIKQYLN